MRNWPEGSLGGCMEDLGNALKELFLICAASLRIDKFVNWLARKLKS